MGWRKNKTTNVRVFQEFRSPIDGRRIASSAQLRSHNAEHGVVNTSEYGDNGGKEYFARGHKTHSDNLTGNTAKARQDRVDDLRRTIEKQASKKRT